MRKYIQHGMFVLRYRLQRGIAGFFRKSWYSLLGMKIGTATVLPRLFCTWPHQVSLGDNCSLEPNIYFKFDGVWQAGASIFIKNHVFVGEGCEFNIRKGIIIEDNCLIASGCKFIDHDHGINTDNLMRLQQGPEKAIFISNNVWLGCNVIVLKGVSIGSGAIVAAGAVVTQAIPANEIWAGVPAKKIGERK